MIKGKFKSERLYDFFIYFISILVLIITLYPLYFIVIASFSNPSEVANGSVWLLPKRITFLGYNKILEEPKIWQGYANTILYTSVGTLINLLLTIPAAYALSRKELKGRRVIMLYFVFTMFFNGGLIPTYLTIRNVHMDNTIWVMMIPFAVNVFNLIVAKTFFESTIPQELFEAARIDGCTNTRFFISIVMPLSKAIVSVMFLYYMVAHWNEYYMALIYLRDSKLIPLQLILRDILVRSTTSVGGTSGAEASQQVADLVKYCIIIVSTAPMLFVYPFIQKYFEKGVMIGSIKG